MAYQNVDSMVVTLSSNSGFSVQPASKFSYIMSKDLPFDNGSWYVAVVSLSVWNTDYNFTAALNNNTIRYSPDSGSTWFLAVIPDGVYSMSELIDEFDAIVLSQGNDPTSIFLGIVQPQITTKWILENGYQVDMSYGNIYQNLGFNPQVYSETTVGQNQAQITNGISNYLVKLNCVSPNSSIVAGLQSTAVYDYFPTVPNGSLFVEERAYPNFILCTHSKVHELAVEIVDQQNRPVILETTTGANPTTIQLKFERRGPIKF